MPRIFSNRSMYARNALLIAGAAAAFAVLLAGGAAPLAASGAENVTPPGTPSSVSVSRSDGSLTASWPAVTGADSYHITYSATGGASWQLAGYDYAGTSITISATNGATYLVGVRARNSGGWGGWRNSSSSGPYNPPQNPGVNPPNPTPAPTPAPTPPGNPSSVSVTRSDGSLTASWPAVATATSYHVTYTSNNRQSWSLAVLNHTGTSITIDVDNDKTYIVGVRARNAGGWGGWRNSPLAPTYKPPKGIDPPPPPPPLP